MNTKQLSGELKEIMEFERNTFQKIEEFGKKRVEKDLATYVKMICKNTAERKISEIQEIYFKKIDSGHLNSN
jgi:hypothetical protein